MATHALEKRSDLTPAQVSQLIPLYEEMVKLKTYPAVRDMKRKLERKSRSLEFSGKKYEELSGRDTPAGSDARRMLELNHEEAAGVRSMISELEALEQEVGGMIQELEDRTTILVLNSKLTGTFDAEVINDILMSTLEKERYVEDRLNETMMLSGVKLKKQEKEEITIPEAVLVPAEPRPSVKVRRKIVRKVSAYDRPARAASYYEGPTAGKQPLSKTLKELRGSRRWDEARWKLALAGWKNEGSRELIGIIEMLTEEHLNELIRLVVADSDSCRNLANLIEKWNGSKYYRWYDAGEKIIEIKTGYMGGLYGLCQLLLFKELKMYPDNLRYFELVLDLYRKPENRYYEFPEIRTDQVEHDGELILLLTIK